MAEPLRAEPLGRTAPRVLTGVGVGPGDPDLLTLRGRSVLAEADVVVVPVKDDAVKDDAAEAANGESDEQGYAERVVRHHLPDAPIVRAPFALTERVGVTGRRAQAWDAAADLVHELFAGGARHVAFATIGDPNVYSTFGYLAATVRAGDPSVETRTVPGITAMQALAAASGTVLCEGREPLLLLPLRGDPTVLDTLLGDELLAEATVVAYKGGRHWPAVRAILAAHDRLDTAVVGAHLGRPDESVAAAVDVTGELPYLSTVLTTPARTARGGKL